MGDSKRRVEGSGLGLAISQKMIQMMGTSIQVNSQLGKGSVFWMDLNLPEAAKSTQEATVVIKERLSAFLEESEQC